MTEVCVRYGHVVCQSCKRNPNIGRKCPVCRQEIIGRATTLEKISERFYKMKTGSDVIIIEDQEEEEEVVEEPEVPRNTVSASVVEDPILEMIFTPRRNDLEELLRFVSNISFLTRHTS